MTHGTQMQPSRHAWVGSGIFILTTCALWAGRPSLKVRP